MRFYALIYFSFPLIPLHIRKKKHNSNKDLKLTVLPVAERQNPITLAVFAP